MEPRNCVLLVDDSAPIRQSLRRAFEQAGRRVCGEAGNGREAIAKAGDLHPQVVVLDLAMPEMNGITAARILKRTLPSFNPLYNVWRCDADEANSVGISAVFSKTEPVAPLLEKARSLVDRNAA